MRGAVEHELKTWPEQWADVDAGAKTLDIRPDDRRFRVGDVLVLREYDPHGRTVDPDTQVETPGSYTGRVCRRVVTHVLPGGQFGLLSGFVALSILAYDDSWPACDQCGGSGYQPCAPGSPHPVRTQFPSA